MQPKWIHSRGRQSRIVVALPRPLVWGSARLHGLPRCCKVSSSGPPSWMFLLVACGEVGCNVARPPRSAVDIHMWLVEFAAVVAYVVCQTRAVGNVVAMSRARSTVCQNLTSVTFLRKYVKLWVCVFFLYFSKNSVVKTLSTTFPLPVIFAPSSGVVVSLPGMDLQNICVSYEPHSPLISGGREA